MHCRQGDAWYKNLRREENAMSQKEVKVEGLCELLDHHVSVTVAVAGVAFQVPRTAVTPYQNDTYLQLDPDAPIDYRFPTVPRLENPLWILVPMCVITRVQAIAAAA